MNASLEISRICKSHCTSKCKENEDAVPLSILEAGDESLIITAADVAENVTVKCEFLNFSAEERKNTVENKKIIS